ncbi:hypothetical protein NDU88_001764 [Pleurodeles waltl]|uniref:Secreted protein n=1 Tax=Pleurodeles waltl TaxID=8319 RepID=A0AAV7WMR8_PLEWA|nr:hypothetical protein NDU88_001764 [Pleurodeles waltl]
MPVALLVLFHCPCPIVYIEAGQEITFYRPRIKTRADSRCAAWQDKRPFLYRPCIKTRAGFRCAACILDCFLQATFETDNILKENG